MAVTLENIEALVRTSSDLVSQLDEQQVIINIIRDATRVLGAESCSVILVDEDTDECYFYSATGPKADLLEKIRFQKDLGIAGKVLKSCKPIVMSDNDRDPDHYRGVDQRTGTDTRSLMCVPLVMADRVIGVLEAVNKLDARSFSDEDLQLLTIFANFAAVALNNARKYDRCRKDAEAFKIAADRGECFPGTSKSMARVWSMVSRVAKTNSTVLIIGESGSGKEVIASAIHKQGERRDRPYICVNCAALESNLLASELFGHEKGAFTGATNKRVGRFELAKNGTIFLDEIADAEQPVQARLLRVLENHQFERLGSSEPLYTDARVIAATNADLDEVVSSGQFREDLYHRLNVVSIAVPPLRERTEDIPGLFGYFADMFSREMNIDPVTPAPDALQLLSDYDWPGNVRELKNLVERASVLCQESSLKADDIHELFPSMRNTAPGASGGRPDPADSLWDTEKQMIEKALADCGWNQSKAARELKISRHHLRYRIKKYGIQAKPSDA